MAFSFEKDGDVMRIEELVSPEVKRKLKYKNQPKRKRKRKRHKREERLTHQDYERLMGKYKHTYHRVNRRVRKVKPFEYKLKSTS